MGEINSKNAVQNTARRAEIIGQLRTILIRRLLLRIPPEDFTEDMELFDKGLGLDSVDALDVAMAVETEYGIAVTDDDMAGFGSIAMIADFIIGNQGSVERANA